MFWGQFPGQVANCRMNRHGEVYVAMPSIANATGGHWLHQHELELAAELSRDDINALLEELSTVDGQTRGKSPPHPFSALGKIYAKLERQRENLNG